MPLRSWESICHLSNTSLPSCSAGSHFSSLPFRSGAIVSRYSSMRAYTLSPSTIILSKSSLKMSRTTRIATSGSPCRSLGRLPCRNSSRLAVMRSHWCTSVSRSLTIASSEAPSAAVRMITPISFGAIFETMPLRRLRSRSDSLRLTPVMPPEGTNTRKRPASVTCEVRRAPLWPIGSLVTCTSTGSPDLNASSMRRGWPSRRVESQLTSPAYSTPLRAWPMSTNAASMLGSTFCTRPR